MSYSLAIRAHGHFDHLRANRLKGLLGPLLVLAMGIVVLAGIGLLSESMRALPGTGVQAVPVSFAPRELPRDWRWERPTVEYEHMYRRDDSPKLDWIRDGRR